MATTNSIQSMENTNNENEDRNPETGPGNEDAASSTHSDSDGKEIDELSTRNSVLQVDTDQTIHDVVFAKARFLHGLDEAEPLGVVCVQTIHYPDDRYPPYPFVRAEWCTVEFIPIPHWHASLVASHKCSNYSVEEVLEESRDSGCRAIF